MNEMKPTFSLWYRIRNSWPGGLRPSQLYISVKEAPHNIESLRVSGEKTFSFFQTTMPKMVSNPRSFFIVLLHLFYLSECAVNLVESLFFIVVAQQTPMLVQWWPVVCDAGPTLSQFWVNDACLLGRHICLYISIHLYPYLCHNMGWYGSNKTRFIWIHLRHLIHLCDWGG